MIEEIVDQVTYLRDIFDVHGDKTLFIDHLSDREQTYREVAYSSFSIAEQLGLLEVGCNKPICILADNSLEMLNLFFGIWQAGCCAVPINPQLGIPSICDILNNFDSHIFVVEVNYREMAHEITDQLLTSESQKLVFFASRNNDENIKANCDLDLETTISQPAIKGPIQPFLAKMDGNLPCMIVFTSGSTSKPKGVSISMNRLVKNERLFCKALGLDSKCRFLHMFPMSYLAGIHNLLLLPICVGSSIVISPPLGGGTLFTFWTMVQERDINTLWFTSTMLAMLMKVDDGSDLTWLENQIRCTLVGMAPLPQATKDAFEKRFHMTLHENFALSETAFISTSVPDKKITPGSKGFILDSINIEARDMNDRSIKLDSGVEGELLVRSPSLMLGYHSAEAEDNENLTEEGFFTGDIGYVHDGELFLTGRKKDLIIRGGINIAPALVEQAIAELPEVLEVAVVGADHAEYGEEVAAALVLADGSDKLTTQQLQKQLKGRLAYFQQPKFIKIVKHLPKGLTGKIDKKEVKKILKNRDGLNGP